MIWQSLTSKALARLDRSIPVVLPVAAVEQHGPHLPLATDRLIAEHFCRELDRELPDRVLILPTVAVGCSQHHMDFPGTLSVSHDGFMRYVGEVLESVVAHGFRTLIIFNSHGGNVAAATVLTERAGAAHQECRFVVTSWWQIAAPALLEITDSGPGGVGHACEFETSLIEVVAPELMDHTVPPHGGNRPTFDWASGDMLRPAGALLYRSFAAATENGVFGRPDLATREKGLAISRAVVEAMKHLIGGLCVPGTRAG